MIKYLLLPLLLIIPCIGVASEQNIELPQDVSTFIEERDLCDHFRGEYPYDEERRKFLEKNLIELCTGTDKKLSDLKRKYKDNPYVTKRLFAYEEDIELNK